MRAYLRALVSDDPLEAFCARLGLIVGIGWLCVLGIWALS